MTRPGFRFRAGSVAAQDDPAAGPAATGSPPPQRGRIAGRFAPLLVVLLLVLLGATSAAAQVAPRERRFVYGLNVFTGTEYTGNFVPPAIDTVYLLADQVSVLDPKTTEVYFWPITNDYRPDWTALNELVPGRLEILRDGRVASTIELTDYVVQFDRAQGIGNGRISTGEQATAQWAEFQRARADYLARLRAYTDATEAYNQRLDEIRQAGGGTPPPAPPEPAPFSLFSTEPARGFPLALPAGEYAIQLRDPSGQVVPDSRKRLVAIAPRRQGVGYEVVPQEKWTIPEQANDPSNAIYTVPGGVVFLRPFVSLEYNALEYARLRNPQDVEATANRWTWVQVGLVENATLLVDGRRVATGEYTVEQIPGAALGYTIVPFERRPDDPPPGTLGARSPDLAAFRVETSGDNTRIDLRLVDAAGRDLAGSARELRVIPGAPDAVLALPLALPLALGLTVVLWRRDRVLTARGLTPEQRRLMA